MDINYVKQKMRERAAKEAARQATTDIQAENDNLNMMISAQVEMQQTIREVTDDWNAPRMYIDARHDADDTAHLYTCAPGCIEKNLQVPAHLLSTVSKVSILNTCAPTHDSELSEVQKSDASQPEEKEKLAPAVPDVSREVEPSERSEHGSERAVQVGSGTSLRSQQKSEEVRISDEVESLNGCAAKPVPTDDPLNFYEIKADLFDNGSKKNSTRFRVKLRIRARPTTTYDNASVFMCDLYSRSRDLNRALRDMGLDGDTWYTEYMDQFEELRSELVEWEIEPRIGIFKDITDTNNVQKVGFGLGILCQYKNQEPKFLFMFNDFATALQMDLPFDRKAERGTNIYKKAIYRDADREQFDVELIAQGSKPKFKTMSSGDFK